MFSVWIFRYQIYFYRTIYNCISIYRFSYIWYLKIQIKISTGCVGSTENVERKKWKNSFTRCWLVGGKKVVQIIKQHFKAIYLAKMCRVCLSCYVTSRLIFLQNHAHSTAFDITVLNWDCFALISLFCIQMWRNTWA